MSALRRILVLAALATLALTASAHAYIGESKTLPTHYGTGTVKITNYWAGNVTWKKTSGSHCLYIQFKYSAVAGADSTWNRLTGNGCATGVTYGASFSRPTSRPFNGMKFRICQDKVGFDSCGGDVNIGMSRR